MSGNRPLIDISTGSEIANAAQNALFISQSGDRNMIRKETLLFTLLGVALISLAGVTASAQGRYSNVYSNRDVQAMITKLEKSSNTFRKEFDRQLDRSPLNGTREEDRLNGIVRDYETALDRLRREFGTSAPGGRAARTSAI
jgi:hypothetical protein